MSWTELGEWWLSELERDTSYEIEITPMLLEILDPVPGNRYLDLGCGEGRIMRTLAQRRVSTHGVELNPELAFRARASSPVAVTRLPDLSCLRDDSYHGAYCVLVLEHVTDHREFFAETARVVRPRGVLALVMNHPIWTAPGSTPISDADGEILWRPGDYFSQGYSDEPAGPGRVVFHHRSIGSLLSSAAAAGWCLDRVIETPHHKLPAQTGIPRLWASRWRLLA